MFATGLRLQTRLVNFAVYEGFEGEPLTPLAQAFSRLTGADVQSFEFPYDELCRQETISIAAQRGSREARFDVILLDDPWFEGLLSSENPAPNSVPGAPVLGAWLLAAPSNRDNQDLAARFITFATSKEELGNAAVDGNPPPHKSVLASE